MAETHPAPPGSLVILSAKNVDDGAGIFVDDREVCHVNFDQSGNYNLRVKPGQTYHLRFELYNVTGGAYHGVFEAKVQNGPVLVHQDQAGQSGPDPDTVWKHTFFIKAA